MTQLIRLYIRHVAIGFALAAVFTGLLLWFNVANLWHLVTHAPGGFLAALLLVMFNGVVFSGVQFGIAVMSLAEDDAGDGGDRGQGDRHLQPIPIRHTGADRTDGRGR